MKERKRIGKIEREEKREGESERKKRIGKIESEEKNRREWKKEKE